ncbi:MAG TPA: histidine phosphatase family protein, partial [Rhizobiales bacterium]|nr:histidine phosphatase family protein [Hyphomicrobiales bacterium]
PLNQTGHEQARNVARTLVNIEPDPKKFQFHASPLIRTRQTMDHVLKAYGISDRDVLFDDRLREVSFGDREGWTWAELNADGVEPRVDPESYFHWRPPGGESYADVAERVSDWLAEVRKPSIVVAHGGVSRVLRGILLGQTGAEYVGLKVPQTKFFKVEGRDIEWFRAG